MVQRGKKRGKVVETGYPTGLLVEKRKKVGCIAKGGGEVLVRYWPDRSLGQKRKESEGVLGGQPN